MYNWLCFIFVNLFEHDLACFVKILLHILQHMLHNIINIFNFICFKSFTNDNVFETVEIKKYTKIETFINIKRIQINIWKYNIIVRKFYYWQLVDLIVLHIIAVRSKLTFNILINMFYLIIYFKILNCWQFINNF